MDKDYIDYTSFLEGTASASTISRGFNSMGRRLIDSKLNEYFSFNFSNLFDISEFNLSKIKIMNFKSIQNSEFDITKTVFLSGLNSSGKSSYTQAVLLILQWISGASSGQKGYLPLNGELISLGQVDDIYNRESLKKGSKNFLDPICIELEFTSINEDTVEEKKYSVSFELTPRFIKEKNTENFTIVNKTDIEITKISSIVSIDKENGHEIASFFEQLSGVEFQSIAKSLGIDKSLGKDNVQETLKEIGDLTVENTYQKTYSNITRRQLAKKNWLGHILTNPSTTDYFYIYDNENGSVPEFIQRIKYGKKEYISSRFFPENIKVGNEILPNGLKSQTSDIYEIKGQAERISNNPDMQINIDHYIKEVLPKKKFTEIENIDSIAVPGEELTRIRLFSEVSNQIKNKNKYFFDKYNLKECLDLYSDCKFSSKEKGFENYEKIISLISKKLNIDNNGYDSEKPHLDQLIGIFLNIFELSITPLEEERHLDKTRRFQRRENSGIPSRENFGFGISFPRLLSKKSGKRYIDSEKKKMNNLDLEPLKETLGLVEKKGESEFTFDKEFKERLFRARGGNLDPEARRVLFKTEQIWERYITYNTIKKIVKKDKPTENRERRFIDSEYRELMRDITFEDFFTTPAGSQLTEKEIPIFLESIKEFYSEFLNGLNEILNLSEKYSKELWKELYNIEKTVSAGIRGIDDELMHENLIKEYVEKSFNSLFPSFESYDLDEHGVPIGPGVLEDIRKYVILYIALDTISSNDVHRLIYGLKENVNLFSDVLEIEKKKKLTNEELATMRESVYTKLNPLDTHGAYGKDSAVDHQGGAYEPDYANFITQYIFSKGKRNELVFVNLNDIVATSPIRKREKDWFPPISENFSFLSGSVNRNYNQIGSKSLLTPLGYHGEAIGTTFNLESENTFLAPTPESLRILDDKKYQKHFFNAKDKIDFYSLNSVSSSNLSGIFSEEKTLAEHLSGWIRYIGFGQSVSAETSEYGAANINIYSDTGIDKITNVGSGVSQALPVILQIILSDNKVLFLEEIEQNLHASAQARLADMILVFSLNQTRSFIIETHSEHLVNRLRLWKMQLSKVFDENSQSPYNVYFAERNKDIGTILKRMDTDEQGYFTEDSFPDGFFDQAQKDIKEIMQKRLEDS